tara:strand:+ start:11690 stop:13555 length:1866 start_codon:yes stop_codon:yes gene_type:complete
MRETRFIQQNKENWEEFERELGKRDKNPNRLSQLYVQITDDLSYARTHYPNRSVRYYLNSLSQSLFLWIYKYRKDRSKTVGTFWVEELPSIMWFSRKDLLASFLIFILSIAAGYFSCVQDPDFVYEILGHDYVEMTIENIEKGDPMAVYKDDDAFMMFLMITTNNLKVATITFLLGLILGVGTIVSLIRNGVMVGVFHHLFFQYDLGTTAIITIMQHGALELSAIVIAGAAGIQIGRGWIFPGTYSRFQSFRFAASRAFKIMLGIAPIIVVAGLIESYITRLTGLSNVIRIGVVVLSFGFILLYYVVFPWLMAPEKRANYEFEYTDIPVSKFKLNLFEIKSSGSIFTDTFFLAKNIFPKFIGWFAGVTLIASIAATFVTSTPIMFYWGNFNPFTGLSFLADYFTSTSSPILFAINSLFLSGITFTALYFIYREIKSHITLTLKLKNWVIAFVFVTILEFIFNAIFYIPDGFLSFIAFFIHLPITLLAAVLVLFEQKNSLSSIGRSILLISKGFGRFILPYLSIFFVGIIFFILYSSPFLWIFIEYIFNLIPIEDASLKTTIINGSVNFIALFGVAIVYGIVLINFTLSYFNLLEISTNDGLRKQIEQVGIKKRFYGLEREG